MAAWPASLPCQPVAPALNIAPEPNVAEFKPDVGSPLRRKRYTTTRLVHQADVKLTTAQMATLLSFYETDCETGALTFTMKDWRTGTTETFSWESPPTFSRLSGNQWMASLALARES